MHQSSTECAAILIGARNVRSCKQLSLSPNPSKLVLTVSIRAHQSNQPNQAARAFPLPCLKSPILSYRITSILTIIETTKADILRDIVRDPSRTPLLGIKTVITSYKELASHARIPLELFHSDPPTIQLTDFWLLVFSRFYCPYMWSKPGHLHH